MTGTNTGAEILALFDELRAAGHAIVLVTVNEHTREIGIRKALGAAAAMMLSKLAGWSTFVTGESLAPASGCCSGCGLRAAPRGSIRSRRCATSDAAGGVRPRGGV